MRLPFQPPIAPMEAKAVAALPGEAGSWQYEPKWDGFRAIAFKDEGNVYLSSRQQLPFSRYFPEVGAAVATLPEPSVAVATPPEVAPAATNHLPAEAASPAEHGFPEPAPPPNGLAARPAHDDLLPPY